MNPNFRLALEDVKVHGLSANSADKFRADKLWGCNTEAVQLKTSCDVTAVQKIPNFLHIFWALQYNRTHVLIVLNKWLFCEEFEKKYMIEFRTLGNEQLVMDHI